MKKTLLSALMLGSLSLAACGDDEPTTNPDPVEELELNSSQNIQTFLEGKTMVMEGSNIPSHPNGLNEDQNWESASQCYQRVTMKLQAGKYQVTSDLGTLRDAPNKFDIGTCDHAAKLTTLNFESTNALIENVAADGSCFDVTYTYPGFTQEGRGSFSADRKTLTLELFFGGAAAGHRCANGAVGASSVTMGGQAFTGNAKQVYVIQ